MNITGHVLSAATGEPLPNAHIYVERASGPHGTTANLEGTYSLDVLPGELLKVSYTGHEPETMLLTTDSARIPLIHTLEPVTLGEFEVVADRPAKWGAAAILAFAILAAAFSDE